MPVQQRIRQLEGQGMSHARIARGLHVSRTTVVKYASREDFSPRPAGRAGRTLIDSGYAEIVEGWLTADLRLPRKQRHTAMRVWQRLREPRVRGFVSVGAALGQAVAGAASRGVGGVCAARVGAGDRAGGFRPGARVDRGRGACGSFPGGLVPVSGHAVCRGVAGRDVGVCVPRAGRGVRACRDGTARGGVRATPRAWGTATRTARSRRP